MSEEFSFRVPLTSAQATTDLAQALAPLWKAGDVVLLSGELGSGKTHFARAVIQARQSAAGVCDEVPSPTFTLVQTYSDGICDIWHADLYRLSDLTDVFELGLEEAFLKAICLVEWPDRLHVLTPVSALNIGFSYGETSGVRCAVIQGNLLNWSKTYETLFAHYPDCAVEVDDV